MDFGFDIGLDISIDFEPDFDKLLSSMFMAFVFVDIAVVFVQVIKVVLVRVVRVVQIKWSFFFLFFSRLPSTLSSTLPAVYLFQPINPGYHLSVPFSLPYTLPLSLPRPLSPQLGVWECIGTSRWWLSYTSSNWTVSLLHDGDGFNVQKVFWCCPFISSPTTFLRCVRISAAQSAGHVV